MTTWTIDAVCALIKKPEVLNALHACRDGHPLNKVGMAIAWRNAAFLVQQQPSYVVPSDAIAWLWKQAEAHQ